MAESVKTPKRKRIRAREEQRAVEPARATTNGGGGGGLVTAAQESSYDGSAPTAVGDSVAVSDGAQSYGAEETSAHHLSDIDVFPREEVLDGGSSDGETPSEEAVDAEASHSEPSRPEGPGVEGSDREHPGLIAGNPEPEREAEARDASYKEKQAEHAERTHRFSDVAVFPRETNGKSDAGSSDRPPSSNGKTETPSYQSDVSRPQDKSAHATQAARKVTEDIEVAARGDRANGAAQKPTDTPNAKEPRSLIAPAPEAAARDTKAPAELESKTVQLTGIQPTTDKSVDHAAGKADGPSTKPNAGPIDAERAAQQVPADARADKTKVVEKAADGKVVEKTEGQAEGEADKAAGGGGKGQSPPAGGARKRSATGVAGGGGGGTAGGGDPETAGGGSGSLGDAALDQWTAATAAATEAVPKPELPEGQAAAGAVEQTATGIVSERAAAEPDYASEAKETQPPVPEAADKEAQLDTSEADQAVASVKALADKRLSPATFSPIGTPPAYPGLNPRDFVPANDLKVLKDLEDRLANKDLTKAERASLTKQLEAVQKHIAAIEEQATKGTAPPGPTTILDEGASSLEPPPPDQAAVLGDAIARAITTIPGRGRALAISAARPLDQGKSPELQELAAGKADAVESEMREELDQIAAAAGISAEQLTGKIAEQQAAVAALAAEQDAATKTAADKGLEARTQRGVEEQAKIAGAKEAVDKEIAAKESAVNGPPDTEAIEAKRDELLGKLEKTGSEVLASYRSSFDKRTRELTTTANKQKGDVQIAADRQAAAIRRHYPDDPDKGAIESLPTKNWATTAAQQVDVEAGRFNTDATTENKGFIETLNDELDTARNTVRDWAAHQEGRERSWWEQLIDMIRDWGKQAVADNEAWERQRAADSRDAMAGDLDALAQLRKAQLSKNKGEVNAALAGLDDEQKVLAARYLRGQGVDSIGFVAESTMLRIVKRRRGELTDKLREEVLRDWDWEQLGVLARATNPEFQPKVIANKVKGSIAGVGTSEDKLFAALGTARGPFERAAVEKCYVATFGISMAEDVDDDVDGTEWDRAEALMKGGTADVAVATIADAIDGAGTDEEAIKEALRGKTPAELE
jgi:hypothetical protein